MSDCTTNAPPAADPLAPALRSLLEQLTGRRVRCIETHISWVLLDGEHAWKLKKPLRLGFIDATSAETRGRLCHDEVRLNRRLAPDVYLDVVPIRGSRAAPQLDGDAPVIDHAVRMRQFANDAILDARVAAGTLDGHQVGQLARRIARFHESAAVAPDTYGQAETIAGDTTRVLDTLAELGTPAAAVAGLRAWCDERARRLAPVFAARRAAGRVRDGHGDLHLANTIVLGDEVTAFDCIEFDPALRMIDVFSDIAFTAMDLMAHGRADLAGRFIDVWLEESGDYDGLPVLRYYLVYRALVRAMTAAIRTAQRGDGANPDPAGPDYLDLARRLITAPAPALVITHGLSGSGKSHYAARFVETHGALRLRSDVIRKRLFGLTPQARSADRHPAGIYGADDTARTYARLLELADLALADDWPVIVDASFLRAAQRRPFRELASARGLSFGIVDCRAPLDVLRARIVARAAAGKDPSEADPAVLEWQLDRDEPFDADEAPFVLPVDTR
ncbi:MAG: AAA family ATPase [Burkholderiaceae bacterium]